MRPTSYYQRGVPTDQAEIDRANLWPDRVACLFGWLLIATVVVIFGSLGVLFVMGPPA